MIKILKYIHWGVFFSVVGYCIYQLCFYKFYDGVIVKVHETPDKQSYYYYFKYKYQNKEVLDKTGIGASTDDCYKVGEKIKVLGNGKNAEIFDFMPFLGSKLIFLVFFYVLIYFLVIPAIEGPRRE